MLKKVLFFIIVVVLISNFVQAQSQAQSEAQPELIYKGTLNFEITHRHIKISDGIYRGNLITATNPKLRFSLQ